ncbi:MAG: isoaspartyl peptidase/L-asparaginase [Rhodothermales bacterium]|nr:isoaspartyl peptidase/L-asparaginase [Rhodothermales bacterium]
MHSGVFALDPGPAVLVHGGAWDIPADETTAHLQGMEAALQEARRVVEEAGDALSAAVAAVSHMEACGVFDAGAGSVLTRNGLVQMDAGVMTGEDLAFGAVAAVSRLRHPIRAAALLRDAGHGQVRLMTGSFAETFLSAHGAEVCDPESLVHPRERERWDRLREEAGFHTSHAFQTPMPRGTVGCVVRDHQGRLAAATSTGGTPFRPEGRVGDSPLPGSGYYADHSAAASGTGWGEAIAAAGLCGRAVEQVARGAAPEAAVLDELTRLRDRIRNPQGDHATAGIILLTAEGDGAWAYNTPRMARAGWSPGSGAWSKLEFRSKTD